MVINTHLRRNAGRILLLAGIGLAIVCSPSAADARCLSPSQIQNAVRSGSILRLAVVARAVGVRGDDILNAELCESGGLLLYRLAVRRPNGRIDNLVVDATSGQPLR